MNQYIIPQNFEMEQAVLGAALFSNSAVDTLLEKLSEEDFYIPAHRRIYAAIADMVRREQTIDTLTVEQELAHRGQLESVGGVAYLEGLANGVATAAHADDYAKRVVGPSILRQLIEALDTAKAKAFECPHDEAEALVLDIAAKLDRILERKRSSGEPTTLKGDIAGMMSRVSARLEGREAPEGILTGHRALDRVIKSLRPGNFVVIAGRPSMGKTAHALQTAKHISAKYGPVAFFSLEMSREEVLTRLAAMEMPVDASLITESEIEVDDFERLGKAAGRIGDLPLFIDDTANLTPRQLRSKCLRMKRKHGLKAVFVDYIQLMSPDDKGGNRNEDVSEISRKLKSLARELGVPLLALSQLSRSVEKREDKRPLMSDLRESGAIEQDADQVWFPYRPKYYDPDYKASRKYLQPEPVECIVAKHRMGSTGIAHQQFIPEYAAFDLIDDRHEDLGHYGFGEDPRAEQNRPGETNFERSFGGRR